MIKHTLFTSAIYLQRPFWLQSERVITNQNRYLWILASPFTVALGVISSSLKLLGNWIDATPFLRYIGCAPKQIGKKVTVYTHNVCCMPGGLPLLFGQINPATNRIDDIAQKINEVDADVVCLQEMCDKAALDLKERLSKNYANIYTNVGTPNLFLESGLFVATKQEVLSAEFIPFNVEGMQQGIVRGFFLFQMESHYIINTHLQPHDEDQKIRQAELEAIIARINTLDKKVILCGDLNIVRTDGTTDEYSKSAIPTYFYNGYHENTATFKDQIIDYILVPKEQKDMVVSIKKVNGYVQLGRPFTDHHGLTAQFNL